MKTADYPHLYDEQYFRTGCGLPYERSEHWLKFFDSIAANIVQKIGPRTTLDAGCAMGFLVESLRERGVAAFGLDISEYALRQVRADIKPYCWLASLAAPIPGRYDLVVCIEVLEHLLPADGERAIDHICAVTDDILFSSSPSDYSEATHINVQPPKYWTERFARHGFVRDLDFNAGFLNSWAVRYRRITDPWPWVVSRYEQRLTQLQQESQELRQSSVDYHDRLAAQEQVIHEQHVLVAEKEQALKTLEMQAKEEAQAAQEQSAAAHEQLAAVQEQLAAVQEQLAAVQEQLAAAQGQMVAVQAQLASAQARAAELALIQTTFGWGVTQFMWWMRRAVAPPASRRSHWLSRIVGVRRDQPPQKSNSGEADL